MRPLLDRLCYTHFARLDSFADYARLDSFRTSFAVFTPSCALLRLLSSCPRVQDFAFALSMSSVLVRPKHLCHVLKVPL